MGWRGAGGSGASDTGAYYAFGGVLMILGSIGEWIVGNTFPFVVFGTFGAFWITFAMTLQPFYNAYGAYSTTSNPAEGLTTVGFNASLAFFMLYMGLLCLVFMICALRTNVVFFLIFTFLVPAFACLAGAYWQLAQGNAVLAVKLQLVAGALTFVVDLLGWWIFFAILLASLDFPFQLPGKHRESMLSTITPANELQLAIFRISSRVPATSRRPRKIWLELLAVHCVSRVRCCMVVSRV